MDKKIELWQFYRDKEMKMVGYILYGYNTDGQGFDNYKGLIVEELHVRGILNKIVEYRRTRLRHLQRVNC